jgi:hypothetical protein
MFAEMEPDLPAITDYTIQTRMIWLLTAPVPAVAPIIAFTSLKYTKFTVRFGLFNLLISFGLVLLVTLTFSLPILQMASTKNW